MHEFRDHPTTPNLTRGKCFVISLLGFIFSGVGAPAGKPWLFAQAPIIESGESDTLMLNPPLADSYSPFEDASEKLLRLAQSNGQLDGHAIAPSDDVYLPEKRLQRNTLPAPSKQNTPTPARPPVEPRATPRSNSRPSRVPQTFSQQPSRPSPASRSHNRYRDPTRDYNPYDRKKHGRPTRRPVNDGPRDRDGSTVFAPTYAPSGDPFAPPAYVPGDSTRSHSSYSIQPMDINPPHYGDTFPAPATSEDQHRKPFQSPVNTPELLPPTHESIEPADPSAEAWGRHDATTLPSPRTRPDAPAPYPPPSYPFNTGLYDPLESPVNRVFNAIDDHLGESSKLEANQFDRLNDRLLRLQDTFERQRKELELQRKLQRRRDQQSQLELDPATTIDSEPILPKPPESTPVEPTEVDTSLDTPLDEPESSNTASSIMVPSEAGSSEMPASPPADDDIVPGITNLPDDDTNTASDIPSIDVPVTPSQASSHPTSASPQLGTNVTIDRGAFADNLFATGRHRLAAEMYVKQLQEDLTPEQKSWTQFQLANCLRHLGDHPGAEKQYRQVAAAQTSNVYPAMARWWLTHLKQTSTLSEKFSSLKEGLQDSSVSTNAKENQP